MKVRNDRSFPPGPIIDLERKGAGRFLELGAALRSGPATLVLGAGASASASLPDWRRLLIQICQVFYGHWRDEIQRGSATVARPPNNLSIVFGHAGEWWTDDVLAMGEEFARGDSILVAQQIKNCIRDVDWYYLLRKALYTSPDDRPIDTSHSALLDRVACLCSRVGEITSIINYNYDDVFEGYLNLHNVAYSVIWDCTQKPKRKTLPIYHTHGYLRRKGGPNIRLILAESEYHEELAAPYSWGNLIQTAKLTSTTCLFVGTSLTDPNLRRLLRSTSMVRSRPHYAFLPPRATGQLLWKCSTLYSIAIWKISGLPRSAIP